MGALFSHRDIHETSEAKLEGNITALIMKKLRLDGVKLLIKDRELLRNVVRQDDPEVLKELEKWGLTAEMVIANTLPQIAIRERRFNSMRFFHRLGVELKFFNKNGDIRDAIFQYDHEMLSVLFEMGLTMNHLTDKFNITPVDIALTQDQELWDYLYERGMNAGFVAPYTAKLCIKGMTAFVDRYRKCGLKLDGFTITELPFNQRRLTLSLSAGGNKFTSFSVFVELDITIHNYLVDWEKSDKE